MHPQFTINVREIEELQTIRDTYSLSLIFDKAKSTVVQGGSVRLVRKHKDREAEPFDELSSEEDLAQYRDTVFKNI